MSSAWENLTPTNWYPSAWVSQTARARRIREAPGKVAAEASGALGISNRTCDESGRERRTATRAPPAEMFKAVANSNKSLPFSSRVRTKTGIASGKRSQLRRSVSGFSRFKCLSLIHRVNGYPPHLGGQITHVLRGSSRNQSQRTASQAANKREAKLLSRACFFFHSPAKERRAKPMSTFDCILLPMCGKLLAFSVDREKPVS